jgi:hypothetical protein
MNTIWELDFYSRPILDDNQKKLWEVLICESPIGVDRSTDSLFRYAQLCSNQQVNSIWLRDAIAEAIAKAGSPPKKIRFFRRQMGNMISKACEELDIAAQESRRTYALEQWMRQRLAEFYPQQPGYQASAAASSFVRYPSQTPQPLPDALQYEQWAFVTLEAEAFSEMAEWDIGFGEAFPLSMMGLAPDTRIPGIIIFSARAKPIAGWMSGLELAYVRAEIGKTASLFLETGASDSWILATNIKDDYTQAEAKGFESAKQHAEGVHFLAVQSDPNSESFAGFWLLQALK